MVKTKDMKYFLKELKMGTPISVNTNGKNKVLMTRLSGNSVENMKNKGVYIFEGEYGKMKPVRKVENVEIKRMLKRKYKL